MKQKPDPFETAADLGPLFPTPEKHLSGRTDPQTSPCKGCGKPILWVETEKGARMPLDPVPVEAGRVIIRMGPEIGKATAHAETKDETAARLRCAEPAARTAFMPHHATCPKAADFRGKQS